MQTEPSSQDMQKLETCARLFEEGRISIPEIAKISSISADAVQDLFWNKGLIKTRALLVGGGAGFIGSNFIRYMLEKYPTYKIINYDKLTYAGNLENLKNIENDSRYAFIQGDIADLEKVESVVNEYNIEAIINFAAETHVARSVMYRADEFLRTNVLGTHALLEAVKRNPDKVKIYIQISTDEVYGTLSLQDTVKFTEDTGFAPNVPYAAAKGGGDLMCRAYYKSYNVPVIVTHCSNNYGPYQHPEKLIPNAMFRALRNQPITLHGGGQHVRDWIYVEDHARAIDMLLHGGQPGEVYNIGSDNEKSTYEIAQTILKILGKPESLITLVPDRPGNDLRYSIDPSKMRKEIGWKTEQTFEEGIMKTIRWYQHNIDWVEKIKDKDKEFSKYIL